MPEKEPLILAAHIRDCCERILEYTKGGKQESLSNPMALDAVCRKLEIIGEAAKKTSPEFRAAVPDIPWRKMAGLRDILIHAYEDTDPETVWDIVEHEIPVLLVQVRRLLGK